MNINKEDIHFLQSNRLLTSEQVYDGAILQLYVNQLRGEEGKKIERELIHHNPAVAILATTEDDQVILVNQYRPAIDQYILEIPAGIIDMQKNGLEQALTAAKRELEEETAYQAKNWQLIADFYVSPGFLNEQSYLYQASDLIEVSDPIPQDDDEFIEIHYFSKDEVKQLIKQGTIKDLKTLFSLNYWLNNAN